MNVKSNNLIAQLQQAIRIEPDARRARSNRRQKTGLLMITFQTATAVIKGQQNKTYRPSKATSSNTREGPYFEKRKED